MPVNRIVDKLVDGDHGRMTCMCRHGGGVRGELYRTELQPRFVIVAQSSPGTFAPPLTVYPRSAGGNINLDTDTPLCTHTHARACVRGVLTRRKYSTTCRVTVRFRRQRRRR